MTEVLTYECFYDRADPEAIFRLALPAAPTCGFLLDAREALIEYVDSLTADWQERGLSPADLAGNLRAATERLIEISLLLPDAPEDLFKRTQVSSIRQLDPTGRLRARNCFSSSGTYLSTQRLSVEWSTSTPRSSINSSSWR